MNNGLRKAAVIGLSACLALSSLSGCSKKEEAFDAAAAAVTVNGDEISAGLVKFAAHYSQALMEDVYSTYMGVTDPMSQDLYGNGSTLGDMVKSDVVSTLERMVLAQQKMGDYGVELTEEEKASVTEAAGQFISDNGEEVLEQMGATQETVEQYLTLRMISARMEPKMSADVDTEVSDEEAAQRKIQYTLFRAETEAEAEAETGEESELSSEKETENVTEAVTEAGTEGEASLETEAETAALTEQGTVKTQAAGETETETEEAGETETGTTTEDVAETETETEEVAETETETEDPAMVAAKEEAKAKAEELIAKLQSGAEFEAASNEVDPDAFCSTMTFGSDSTNVVEGLITATEGLEDGAIVEEPIEASSGYYVAQVISKLDREATDEKKEDIVEDRKSDRISELYTQWQEEAEITENEEVLAKITFDFCLTQETEAQTEDGTEETTEDVTEIETAAEAETDAETEVTAETETDAAAETDSETETETESAAEAVTEAVTE